MSSTAMDWYNARKHDPAFLKVRADRSKKYRERVGRPMIREQERSQNDQLREQVLEQYDRKCANCGFDSDIRILQLDHLDGNGNKERRKIGVRGVRRNALQNPKQYQLLCPNCNWIKRFNCSEHNPRKL